MTKSMDLSRRRFLLGTASTAALACLPLGSAHAQAEQAPGASENLTVLGTSSSEQVVVLNRAYRLLISTAHGAISSIQSLFGSAEDLLVRNHAALPLLKIELSDGHGSFRTIDSSHAAKTHVVKQEGDSEDSVSIDFRTMGSLPVDAHIKVRCPHNESLTYWSLELANGTPLWIAHVQFPVLQVPFDDVRNGEKSSILTPFADGLLTSPIEPSTAAGNWGQRQLDTEEVWRHNNYPGQWASTQLMAYYNDVGGLYLACDDAAGLPKFIGPLIKTSGVTLGLGHYPGTHGPGQYSLPYHVVLGTFQGDWYAAAEIYRNWASKQAFCSRKLRDRSDMPGWIRESPVFIAFPMRGEADWDGPAKANPEYAPATNALPYLGKLASGMESSLTPIVFNWEHGGPWVQPDAFPPVGGEASMKQFMAQAKQRGWHPMVYGDGLSWVTWQKNTDYDGMPYFRAHNGEASVVRNWDGKLLESDLSNWRKGYLACVGTAGGRDMILGMTRGMAEFGPAIIQQFDQGPGPVACYAHDHGHPPVPGPWMTEDFNRLLEADTAAAHSIDSGVAMSCEGAPPESFLQKFQTWDARARTCPLYSFLYHEYANGQEGFYTNRYSDETLRLSVGRALVTGYMLNFTLRDKGQIEYDWDQLWSRAVPDQRAILNWAKRVNHFRARIAPDYLIFGKMLRPWKVENVTYRDFGWGEEPVVQSATWQSQAGKIGVVFANCGNLPEKPSLALEGRGQRRVKLTIDGRSEAGEMTLPAVVDLQMGPRSLALVELEASAKPAES